MVADTNIVVGIKSDGTGARVIKRDLDDISKKGDRASKSASNLEKNILKLVGSAAIFAGFTRLIQSATAFERSLSEINTLLDDQRQFEQLRKNLIEINKQFGGNTTAQAKALYDIVSAGATTAAQATETLTAANKLAIAGVTNVSVAADGLTSVLNAYGSAVKGATDVSDILFTGVRAGKTTVDQLASSLGKVAPLAATANVSFEELVSSIAALTKGGIATTEAVTGVRAILAAVTKPTKEASDAAKQLGIDFTASGLASKGFVGFLEDVVQKTGGSSENLGVLFSGVEALVPVLALAGEAGDSFAETLAQMGNRAGVTDTAFNKMNETAGQQTDILFTKLRLTFVGVGTSLLDILNPAIKAANENFDTILATVNVLAGSALPALSILIGKTLVSSVTALSAVVLANPLFFGATILSGAITALITFQDEIKITQDGTVTMGDALKVVFDDIGSAIDRASERLIAFRTRVDTVIERLQNSRFAALLDRAGLGGGGYINDVRNRAGRQAGQRNILSLNNQNLAGGDLLGMGNANDLASQIISDKAAENARKAAEQEKAVEKVTKKLSEQKKEVQSIASSFENDMIQAFKGAFSAGTGFFDRLLDGAKSAFTNFIGEIAFQASKPIVLNLVGASAGASVMGAGSAQASGGGGIGGLNLLSNLGSSVMDGLNAPIFGAESFVGGGINKIGASIGLDNLASEFTPGAALGGIGGNLLANAIFGGDRGIGASIGGGIGGVAGTVIGAKVLGTALGSFGGPVGALAGAFIGNAIGGLIGGGKPSDKAQTGSINLATLDRNVSGQTGNKFSQENADFRDSILDYAGTLSQALQDAGAELDGALRVTIGSRDGLRLGGYSGQNFGTNSQAFSRAINEQILGNVSGGSQNLQTALGNVDRGNSEEILKAIGIVQLIDGFEKTAEAARPLGDVLDVLDAQFKELKSQAQGLGLPIDKLTESYEKQKDTLIKDVLSPLQSFLDQQALGGDSSFNPGQRLSLARSNFDENLSRIQAGDFSDLNSITQQASQLLSIGRDVFASGQGFVALESFVRQSIAGISGDLGAPGGLDSGLSKELTLSSAKQTSLQEQMLLELRELRTENIRLRKAYERAGNQAVT